MAEWFIYSGNRKGVIVKELRDPKLLELAEHVKHIFIELGIYKNLPKHMQEHIEDTPYRIVKAWKEFTISLTSKLTIPTTFTNPVDELVYITDIEFNSLCCHHFFPFSGKVHLAYLPNESLIGLSKPARIVRHFAKKPQLQELMLAEIANYIFDVIKPTFLMLICKANHTCCSSRGAESSNPMIISSIRCAKDFPESDRKSLKQEVLDTIAMKDRL